MSQLKVALARMTAGQWIFVAAVFLGFNLLQILNVYYLQIIAERWGIEFSVKRGVLDVLAAAHYSVAEGAFKSFIGVFIPFMFAEAYFADYRNKPRVRRGLLLIIGEILIFYIACYVLYTHA